MQQINRSTYKRKVRVKYILQNLCMVTVYSRNGKKLSEVPTIVMEWAGVTRRLLVSYNKNELNELFKWLL